MDDTNFEQFIDLIRGESSDCIVKFCPNYDCEHIRNCLDDNLLGTVQENLFGFHSAAMSTPNSAIDTLQLAVDGDGKDGEEENNMEEEFSGTTTTITTPKKKKGDRSRTLVSERRRRGGMKEKLYALRALMDKASIVGDAVLYVQDLQMQMDMFQVEERGFYARVECNRGQGVAASLYKAIASLTRLNVLSSNLGTLSERFILTFTSQVRERETDMNLPNLKLWVAGALLNQGFVFQTQPSA
ncbi:FER-like regulator of iron uptake [Actinidia rufa]|uniref:FER-like regulator of iron uptake n=1 Tax=Actinidia rufa TaxID=165716 RepID=A0A7J0H419_9ERIC|nr:FER-like regulator of iron uptake [Actinidia rufa]